MLVVDAERVPEAGSPEWWLLRLLHRLQGRRAQINRWSSYYAGDQPLAFASEKFREAFGDRFPAFTSNFCSLVVDGTSERLEVAGFRFADKGGDKDVWELWQANEMDAASQLAHTEALIKGCAYALVEPVTEGYPVITIEDALEAVVEADPRRPRKRLAGLKAWVDSDGHLVVYLYLPDLIYKYRSERPSEPLSPAYSWPPRGATDLQPLNEWTLAQLAQLKPLEVQGEQWPAVNRLGVVPLVELPNRPRLGVYGQSEIQPIQSNQDAVNKYRCDALIASEFAAFPQRYLLNYEPEVDKDTMQPKEPFRAAIDRIFIVPPQDGAEEGEAGPKLQIGQFEAASLEPYSLMIGLEVGHMSAISRLPYHELLRSSVPPSGEMLKASETGLVRKVGRAELFLGQGWEQVLRVSLKAMSDPRADVAVAETIWRDEETRNEAVRTDAVVKLHGAKIIDDELAWEMIGLTPTQAERLKERRELAAQAAAAAGEPNPNLPNPPANGAGAGTVVPAPTGPRMSPAAPANGGYSA